MKWYEDVWHKRKSMYYVSDTKPCPKCGTECHRGSGYFSTDYLCQGCGTEFNSAGQVLSQRSQWGEETGEQF